MSIKRYIITGNFFKVFNLCSAAFFGIPTAKRKIISCQIGKRLLAVCPIVVNVFAACYVSATIIRVKCNIAFPYIIRKRNSLHHIHYIRHIVFIIISYNLNIISFLSYSAENNIFNILDCICIIFIGFKAIKIHCGLTRYKARSKETNIFAVLSYNIACRFRSVFF